MLTEGYIDDLKPLSARALLQWCEIHGGKDSLATIIHPVSFYKTKAKHIISTCIALYESWGGDIPRSPEDLLSLKGNFTTNITCQGSEPYVFSLSITMSIPRSRSKSDDISDGPCMGGMCRHMCGYARASHRWSAWMGGSDETARNHPYAGDSPGTT